MRSSILRRIAPVVIFIIIVSFLGFRLLLIGRGVPANNIPSVMIGHRAPAFTLPSLADNERPISLNDLKGKVVLLNFFASWCASCRAEHAALSDFAAQDVIMVGIDYKDRPDDARKWLHLLGNPYEYVLRDAEGRTAIDFGLYGVPETYLIDQEGIIRYKATGPLTAADLREQIEPRLSELTK